LISRAEEYLSITGKNYQIKNFKFADAPLEVLPEKFLLKIFLLRKTGLNKTSLFNGKQDKIYRKQTSNGVWLSD